MKKYKVRFHGRTAGAIGIFYNISAVIEAENDKDFANKFSAQYDLSGQTSAMVALNESEDYKPFDFTRAFDSHITPNGAVCRWSLIDRVKGYSFWQYEDADGRTVYNVTEDGKAPKTDGGYYRLWSLAKAKGVQVRMFDGVTVG